MLNQKLKKNKGFTIMETLIAISLLLLAITGPMVFAQNALRAAFSSRDQVTAFYLAQDAIEFVKNVRDHNLLDGAGSSGWLDGFEECASGENGAGGCSVATYSALGEILSCDVNGLGCLGNESNASNDEHLKIDNGIIGHSGTEDSIYSRTVFVDGVGDEAKVTVKVRWKSNENIGAREITVVEYLYNWAGALLE